jgi:hypothetical protein
MIVSPVEPPYVSSRFAAMVVWLNEKPLKLNQTYLLKHACRQVKAKAIGIRYQIDVNALSEHAASELEMNAIAAIEFETSAPLFFDTYNRNRTTGSFILIDAISNATVGAAMIREDLSRNQAAGVPGATASLKPRADTVTPKERHKRHGHRAAIFSVVGDSALAGFLEQSLFENGFEAVLVRAEEVPASALPILVSALWEVGLVIVHSSAALSSEEKAVLENVAGEWLFEVAVVPSGSAQEALRQALANAEKLCVANDRTGLERVD